MTAQNSNGAQDFSYPQFAQGDGTNATPPAQPADNTQPTPQPAPVADDSTTPAPVAEETPAAQPAQEISGPSFDEVPAKTEPVQTPEPVEETPEPAKEEPKTEEKPDNPLEALAEKLNALKSELVEEVDEPKKEEEKSEPLAEEKAEPEVETTPEPAPEVETPVEETPATPEPIPTPEPVAEAPNEDPLDAPVNKPEATIPSLSKAPSNVIHDDLSAIMPEQDEDDEVVVGEPTLESPEGEEQEDLTSTGPEAIQDDAPAGGSPGTTTSVALGSSGELKNFKGGKYPLTITDLLDMSIQRDASDIHISVGYPVMMRIDGTLVAVHDHVVSPANAEELILPVLSEQKKELLEVNREVDLAYAHQNDVNARFRINAYYTREHLAAAFRLIPSKIRTIEELSLPPIYSQFAKLAQGLVLVTGPTGHGKSTTLAALIQEINMKRASHILTIEDPIEYIFPKGKSMIDQREMHDDTHSWTIALKSALRQDPDVILVGEMRDYETIASTITLAETGHLVFATLHTNSASQTIDRIIDVFPENQQAQIRTQLANILEAVVAQRLIPLDEGGRRAVSEIMIGTPAVRNLIREGKTHQIDNVIRTSADVGMISLESSLVKLVRDGKITMDKAQEFAVHPEEVVRLLKG